MENDKKDLWGVWSYLEGLMIITDYEKAQKFYNQVEGQIDLEDIEELGPQLILFKIAEQMTVVDHEPTKEEPWEWVLNYYKNDKVKGANE